MIFNYIRVSTIQQKTERQLLDVPCDREYLDKLSGKDKNRPQLQAMLDNLRKGDIVNIHELSRLGRNTKDLLNMVDEIISKEATVHFHKENLIFDGTKKADPFQQLMLGMLSAISQFERELMLERQREGIAIAQAQGKYKGRKSSFTSEIIDQIKKQFLETKNKAQLAREYGISRGYLYELVKN